MVLINHQKLDKIFVFQHTLLINTTSTPVQQRHRHHQLSTPPSNQRNNSAIQQTFFSTPVQINNTQKQQHHPFMERHFNSAPPSTAASSSQQHFHHFTTNNNRTGFSPLDPNGLPTTSDCFTSKNHRINRSLSYSEDSTSVMTTPSVLTVPPSHNNNEFFLTQNNYTNPSGCRGENTHSQNLNPFYSIATCDDKKTVHDTFSGMSVSRENTSSVNLSQDNTSNLSVSRGENTSGDGFPLPVNVLLNDLPVPETLPNLTFSPSKPLHETSFSEVKQFLKTPQKLKSMKEEERKLKEAACSSSSSPFVENKQSTLRTPQKLKSMREEERKLKEAACSSNSSPLIENKQSTLRTPQKLKSTKEENGKSLTVTTSTPENGSQNHGTAPRHDDGDYHDDNDHEGSHFEPLSPPGCPMDEASMQRSSMQPTDYQHHQGDIVECSLNSHRLPSHLATSTVSTPSSSSCSSDDTSTSNPTQTNLTSQTVSTTRAMAFNKPPSPSLSDISTVIQQNMPNLTTTVRPSSNITTDAITNAVVKNPAVATDDIVMKDTTEYLPITSGLLPPAGVCTDSFNMLPPLTRSGQNMVKSSPIQQEKLRLNQNTGSNSGIVTLAQSTIYQQQETSVGVSPATVRTTPTKKSPSSSIASASTTKPLTNHVSMVTPTKSTLSSPTVDDEEDRRAKKLTRVINRKDSINSESSPSDVAAIKKYPLIVETPTTPTTTRNPPAVVRTVDLSPQPPLTKDHHTTGTRKVSSPTKKLHNHNQPTGSNRRTKQQQQLQQRQKQTTFDYEQRLKERAAEFANIYFNRVCKVLVDDDGAEVAAQFFALMQSANRRSMSKLETYHRVADLLADYPELVDSFVGFLDQHEARHVGKVSTFAYNTLYYDKVRTLQYSDGFVLPFWA